MQFLKLNWSSCRMILNCNFMTCDVFCNATVTRSADWMFVLHRWLILLVTVTQLSPQEISARGTKCKHFPRPLAHQGVAVILVRPCEQHQPSSWRNDKSGESEHITAYNPTYSILNIQRLSCLEFNLNQQRFDLNLHSLSYQGRGSLKRYHFSPTLQVAV